VKVVPDSVASEDISAEAKLGFGITEQLHLTHSSWKKKGETSPCETSLAKRQFLAIRATADHLSFRKKGEKKGGGGVLGVSNREYIGKDQASWKVQLHPDQHPYYYGLSFEEELDRAGRRVTRTQAGTVRPYQSKKKSRSFDERIP